MYKYDSGRGLPLTLMAFKNRACSRRFDDGFIQPTPAEVRQLIKLCGWTQTTTAKLTGVAFSKKASSTVRRWQVEHGDEMRAIPYSAWRLLLVYAGKPTR